MTTYSPTSAPGGDPTNVLGRRIGAFIIDLVILLVIVGGVTGTQFLDKADSLPASTYRCSSDDDLRREVNANVCLELDGEIRFVSGSDATELQGTFWTTFVLIGAGNLILLQGLTGASIGKLLVGLRVVRGDTGTKANIGWAALRWVLLWVDGIGCFILPGIALAASTKGHRRLGDMAAGTFVVRTEHVGRPVLVPGLTADQSTYGAGYTPPSYGAPTGWDVGSQPPAPGSWGAPATGPGAPAGPSAPAAPAAPAAAPGADSPTWDAARNAYIQYDRELASWMQWDDATNQWKPISQ